MRRRVVGSFLLAAGFVAACGGGRNGSDPFFEPLDAGSDARDAPTNTNTNAEAGESPEAGEPQDGAAGTDARLPADGSAVDAAPPGTDAAPPTPDASGCETPDTVYRDEDDDGYGAGSPISTCGVPDGYAPVDGDCHDGLEAVNPGQEGFLGDGYEGEDGLSFDYDCDGEETADPDNDLGEAPVCPLTLVGCTGAGYLPFEPARAGGGRHPLCGSTQVLSCVNTVLCSAETTEADAFRCR